MRGALGHTIGKVSRQVLELIKQRFEPRA